MEGKKKLTPKTKKVILILAAIFIICGGVIIGMPYILDAVEKANKVASTEKYNYVNPDESKADADEGFKIDGVFDEEVYQNNKWLYLENTEGGADCNIAMTSYFGEKGMYFAYDVDERTPINVNLERDSFMNSCIEMYLSPGYSNSLYSNGVFEIDLLPTGDINFKRADGKGGWSDVRGSHDVMAYLGTSTKGGPVNSEECNGYTLELFIPWVYLERWGVDVEEVQKTYVNVNPAHITSFNYKGTDANVDRYHYWFAQQVGGSWGDVATHFRFDKNGAQDTVDNEFVQGDHYTIEGPKSAIPGMKGTYKVVPDKNYAITSFVVNGKEYIKDVNFLKDGTVVLTTREKTKGLKISATAEVVTGGKKTLTGTLSSNKLGDANISDAKMTYKGKKGVKQIKFDANGKFTLTNLEQGYYTITAEKSGYKKVTRTIYLNRDMDINVVLDYDRFETIDGNAWILDEQNNDMLMRFGGASGATILTKDAYKNVAIEANFRYDVKTSTLGDADAFVQQRQGYRVLFSNEKVFHVDLLRENGEYIIQYAAFSGDKSLFSWKKAYVLSPAEITKYQSENGIKFELQRSGRLINLLLDGKVVANEYLDAEYANLTARVGFESWVGKREVVEVPYKISQKSISANGIFKATQGWDISRENQGILTVTGTSDGKEDVSIGLGTLFNNYRDISMKIRDAKNDGKFAMKYTFEFANGESFQLRFQNLTNQSNGNRDFNVQLMATGENTITGGWDTVSGLSDAQKQKFFTEGIEFRVAIINESAHIYLDGTEVGVIDLSVNIDKKPTNIKNVPARITAQLYGNGGVTMEVPFNVSEVAVGIRKSMYGTVTANKTRIKAGDTVVLTARNDDNTVCKQIKIDGKVYPLDANGQISFKAQASGHTIEGIYNKKEIFKSSATWDITKESSGIVSSMCQGIGDYVVTAEDSYRQASVKVKDLAKDGKFSIIVQFSFTNGEKYAGRITTDGTAMVQVVGGNETTLEGGWATITPLSQKQVEKLQSEGLELTMSLIGSKMYFLLDGMQVGVRDISKKQNGEPSNIINDTAAIGFRLDGSDNGKYTDVEFDLKKVAILNKQSMYGTVTTDKESYVPGETITITARNDDNTVCTQVKVDGRIYPLDANGQMRFKAQLTGHTIEGIYNKKEIFNSSTTWDTTRENSGVVSSMCQGFGAYLTTTEDSYRQASVKVKDLAKDGKFSIIVQFSFTNGEKYAGRITTDGTAMVQVVGGNETTLEGGWATITTLSPKQIEKLQSEGLELTMSLVGSKMYFLLDGMQIGIRDLSKKQNGEPSNIADDTATIGFRLDGSDNGQYTDVEFDLKKVAIVKPTSTFGTVTTDKESYVPGEVITVTATNKDGSPSHTLSVDGKEVALDAEGKYSFKAGKGHVLEGVFAGEFFAENGDWDLTEQANGILKVMKTTNDGSWVATKRDSYRGMSMKVRDYDMNEKGFCAIMRFTFTNNEVFIIRLNNADNATEVTVQVMDGYNNTLGKGWTSVGASFSQTLKEKLWGDGVEFGVYIVDEKAQVYIDGQHWGEYDLSTTKAGAPSKIADETARIDVKIEGNVGYRLTVPFTLTETNIVIKEDENGTATVDKRDYLLGDDVVVKVDSNEGVFCSGVEVDGELIELNGDGTCTFKASKPQHTIVPVYEEAIFKPNPKWDVQKQLENVVTILKTEDGYSSWLETLFTYTGVEITAKYHNSEPNDYGMALSLKFANDQDIRVRLTNADSDGSVFKLQAMDGSISPWKNFYTLNDDQVAKLKGDGLKFKLLREGTKLDLYLDGNVVVNDIDLTANDSGVTEDMNSIVRICLWGNAGVDTEVPFELLGGKEKVILNIAESANGSVAGVKKTYRVDDDVVLKVTGNNGYACKELRVDGNAVDIAANGTYTFKATKTSYDVEAVFDKAIFQPNGNYEVGGQFFGAVALTNNETAFAGFLNTEKDTYRDLTVTARRVVSGDYCMITAFEFTNGEKFVVRLNLEGNAKTIQIMPTDGNTFKDNWKDVNLYTLSEAQAQKVNGEGIDYRVAIIGEKAYFFLDGFLATTYDLSMNVKGEPTNLANVGARIGIRMDGNKKTEVGIPFKLGAEPARVVTPTLAAGENGRLELDAEAYYEGQNAIVTVVPNEGYVLDTLKFDGEVVTPNADGTFAFAITKDDHRVEATFAKPIWTSESTEWNLMNQSKGYLEVTAKTAPTANAVASGNYSQIATTVKYTDGMKDGSGNFIVTKRLTFSNNRYGTAQLILDNTGNLKLKLDGSALQARDKKEIALDAAYAAKIATDGVEFKITRSGRTINYYIDGVQVYTLQTAPQVTASMAIKNIQLSANIAINKTLKLPFVIQ